MRVSKREKERKRRQRARERTAILVLNTLFKKKKEEEDIGVYFNSTVHYGETKSRRAIIRPLRER